MAADKDYRVLDADMLSKRFFQPAVDGAFSRNQSTGGYRCAVTVDSLFGRNHDFRVTRESQVVITREIQHFNAANDGPVSRYAVMDFEIGIPNSQAVKLIQPLSQSLYLRKLSDVPA